MITNQAAFLFPKDKEKQLYKAVIDMINEDVDVYSLTVSDIAKKAGVGKGTTYEYFKTKEELIAKALFYDIFLQIETVKSLVEKNESFHDRFMVILDYMEEQKDNIKPFNYAFRFLAGSNISLCQMSDNLGFNHDDTRMFMEGLIEWFYEKAREENLIGEGRDSSLLKSAILSQIVEFTMILHNPNSTVDSKSAKEYIYEGLLAKIR